MMHLRHVISRWRQTNFKIDTCKLAQLTIQQVKGRWDGFKTLIVAWYEQKQKIYIVISYFTKILLLQRICRVKCARKVVYVLGNATKTTNVEARHHKNTRATQDSGLISISFILVLHCHSSFVHIFN